MLSEFKLAHLFVIRSPSPEKILSAGTLVPIIIKKRNLYRILSKLSTPFLQGFWTKSLGWCLIPILLINPLNLHKTCLTMSKSNMLYKIYYIVNNRGVLIFDGAYFRFLHEFAQNKGRCLFSRGA